MGQILYHSASVEISGPDGRLWSVTIAPPEKNTGDVVQYDCTLLQLRDYDEWELSGGELDNRVFHYTLPSPDGFFAALAQAVNLIPTGSAED